MALVRARVSQCAHTLLRPTLLRRQFSAAATATTTGAGANTAVGLVFDIDGVIIRGKHVLPQAQRAFQRITAAGSDGRRVCTVPTIFMTNGGGCFESHRAKQLSEWLGIHVDPEQVVLSHSPMRMFSEFFHRDVLVVGQGPIRDVARSYGFHRVHTMGEVTKAFPVLEALDHSRPKTTLPHADPTFPRIDAIFCMSDPLQWEMQLQVLCDILTSDGRPGHQAREQIVHLFFSNPDFLWQAEWSQPRFGMGAFALSLSTLYKELTGNELRRTFFGKPHGITYEYGEALLERQAKALGYDGLHTVYGIGDNPRSDIRGANARPRMRSVLVRTGVYKGGLDENDRDDPAAHVVEDVEHAVDMILAAHGSSRTAQVPVAECR